MTYDPLGHGPRRTAPPGGADRAIATGRRRLVRRRTAGTAAGLSVAVVAGAALGGGNPGTRGLTPADEPTGQPTSTGTPGEPVASPTNAGESPYPGGEPTTEPTASGTPGTAQPTASATGSPTSYVPYCCDDSGSGSTEVTTTDSNDPAACSARPEQATYTAESGFCTILTGPLTVSPGDPAKLSLSLCRPGGMAARTVTFETNYEFDLNVARAGASGEEEVWAWAHRDDFAPRRHTVTFDGGDCRTWTVTWRGQGNDGKALAPGEYQVNGYPYAYDWTHEDGDDAMGPAPQYYTVEVTD